jgi:hypothetical protein
MGMSRKGLWPERREGGEVTREEQQVAGVPASKAVCHEEEKPLTLAY